MPNTFETLIKTYIQNDGPLDVGAFMNLALGHSTHGYYMKQDPFGAGGDFTTAPEISQMFGEMIGAWCVDLWMQMGSPSSFCLVECGPGRGTLMADLLRAARVAPAFLEAAHVHLIEISPALKAKQKDALSLYDVSWHDSVEDVPDGCPVILIGNEFLDALAFRQLMFTQGTWRERVIDYDGGLRWGLRKFTGPLPDFAADPKEGDVFEFSPAREGFVQTVAARLKRQGGAALLIDYGHSQSGFGDSFQAVKGHDFVDVLSHVGDADLTSHVDFEALTGALLHHPHLNPPPQGGGDITSDVRIHGPVTQGAFLKALGVEVRADMLKKNAPDIGKDLHRLIDDAEMGTLFKVLGLSFYDGKALEPAGF